MPQMLLRQGDRLAWGLHGQHRGPMRLHGLKPLHDEIEEPVSQGLARVRRCQAFSHRAIKGLLDAVCGRREACAVKITDGPSGRRGEVKEADPSPTAHGCDLQRRLGKGFSDLRFKMHLCINLNGRPDPMCGIFPPQR
jgi:hypothetical protein